MSHVHAWTEIHQGYYECPCGASKLVSTSKKGKQ